jgi:N-acetylglutamate synthase-like GNAT family acetyltransferase
VELVSASAAPPRLGRADDGDAGPIRDLVTAAYEHYIPLIGRKPMTMLTDYAVAVREHDVWVLEAAGTIVGVLELVPRNDHLWLENVAISPNWQGRGFGRRLLEHAESEARRARLPEVRLLTNERWVDDIAWYTSVGYRKTHRQPHLGTDLVYFTKPLGAGEKP